MPLERTVGSVAGGPFTSTVDFNRRAERWAVQHGKPIVGNCDVHRLAQLGTTYSLVDASAEPDAICEAVADGRVTVESAPLAWIDVARILGSMTFGGPAANSLKIPATRVARRLQPSDR